MLTISAIGKNGQRDSETGYSLRRRKQWPHSRVLELAPAYWNKTLEQDDTRERLAANIYRKVVLGEIDEHQQPE